MKTIIVPTDFSPISKNAAHYAVDLAKAIQADVVLHHAAVIPIAVSEIHIPPSSVEFIIDDAKKSMLELKDELTQYCNNSVEITTIITMGNLMDDTADIAAGKNIFAVIMGIQGSGAGERFVFGSNAISAMHKLSYPVILVPHAAKFKRVENICLACDMSNIEEIIPANYIEELLAVFGCKLHILYVNKTGKREHADMLSASVALQKIFMRYHPQFHFITGDTVEAGISHFIASGQMDMLLIIPREHGFPGSVFHRSVSKDVALHLPVPVIAIHKA